MNIHVTGDDITGLYFNSCYLGLTAYTFVVILLIIVFECNILALCNVWCMMFGLVWLCYLAANIRMSQKVAKPTLTGQRIKTRKRGECVAID